MRALFGIVGVLVVVGVIVYWLGPGGGLSHTETVLKSGESAKEQMAQIGGKDTQSHEPADQSAVLEPQMFAGRPDSLLVTKVVPGGAFERYFGLKLNDAIVATEFNAVEMKIKEQRDGDAARDAVLDAYSKSGHIVVMRDGNEIRLPPASAQTGHAPKSDSDPLQKQLDAIQQIPGSR